MKKLFAILMFVSFNAYADAWYIENKLNGQIVITDTVCYMHGQKYESLKSGYARSPDGRTLNSCWYFSDNIIHMIYEDNVTYTYPAKSFIKMQVF